MRKDYCASSDSANMFFGKIFHFSGLPAPNMSLGFVFIEYGTDIEGKPHIDARQPFHNVLMYGGFRYAVFLSGIAYGSIIIYYIGG